jgi:hypothetical protein
VTRELDEEEQVEAAGIIDAWRSEPQWILE